MPEWKVTCDEEGCDFESGPHEDHIDAVDASVGHRVEMQKQYERHETTIEEAD